MPRATRCSARPNMPKLPSNSHRLRSRPGLAARRRCHVQGGRKLLLQPIDTPRPTTTTDRWCKKYHQYAATWISIVARRFAIARYWEQSATWKHHHWSLTPNFTDKTRPHFDTRGHCPGVYDRVRLDDPTGPAGRRQHHGHGQCLFSVRACTKTPIISTRCCRRNIPSSEHQFNAHLLGFKPKLLRYQGPDYGNRPLDEADESANNC